MNAHTDHDTTWLHALLHRLEQVLPAQAPIKDFVHHNTLHGFQHLHFRAALAAAETATGIHGYQSPATFRAYFSQGRIDLTDLNAALDETPELRADDKLVGVIARRDVLLAALRFDLTPLPGTILNWRIEEMAALERFQAEVSADAKKRLLANHDNEAACEVTCLAALWRACGEVLAPPSHTQTQTQTQHNHATPSRQTMPRRKLPNSGSGTRSSKLPSTR
jgi:uncharacterized protein